jgi:hypothetical protein
MESMFTKAKTMLYICEILRACVNPCFFLWQFVLFQT